MTHHLLIDGDDTAECTVVLAHGAGLAMDSPFMQDVATGLAERGLSVVRFEFPYMAKRREDGTKRGPDATARLLACYGEVLGQIDASTLIIGGKSLGGRIASMLADEYAVQGLVCLGYPFHPPGKPERTRTAHLEELRTPALILQGERDPFGNRQEVASYRLSDSIEVRWLADGDHGFKPRKRSGFSAADHLATAVDAIAQFAVQLTRTAP